MKAAHGGQVLLSQAVVDHVGRRLPPLVSLRDLGGGPAAGPGDDRSTSTSSSTRTCGRIFRRCARSRRRPTICRSRSRRSSGASARLAEIKRLLERHAPADAAGHGRPRQDPACRCRSPPTCWKHIRTASGSWTLHRSGSRRWFRMSRRRCWACAKSRASRFTQTLCAHVKDHKLLFVLDNCEHLVSACASLADALLRGARRTSGSSPRAARRCTSAASRPIPVLPLAVPDRNAGRRGAAAFGSGAAVRGPRAAAETGLLADRARSAGRGRALRAARRHSARAGTGGSPNALVVDRVRSTRGCTIGFKLLTGGSRVALERQRTLRALVELVVRSAAGATSRCSSIG